jgi:hypothetical protein
MSDIWDEFEKTALAQGLISVADDDEENNKTTTRRNYESLSDDAIRLLYGIEPENIYKTQDMIDAAHPDTAVICPAYDAMNSVVENLHQRQDVMTYIALKTPNGQLIQRRYVAAKKDLVNSLVSAAFVLDNNNDKQLMSFADSCAVRVDQRCEKIVKEAVWGLAAGIAAGAALLGAAYYTMFGATDAQDVYNNAYQVLEALEPLSEQPYADAIRKDVTDLMNSSSQMKVLNNKLSSIKSIKDAVTVAQKSTNISQIDFVNSKRKEYIDHLKKIYLAIPRWVAAIKNTDLTSTDNTSDWAYKAKSITEKFYWKDSETLIDKLYGYSKVAGIETLQSLFGKNSITKEGDGGLRKAILNDVTNLKKAIENANNEAKNYAMEQQRIEQQKLFEIPEINEQIPTESPNQKPQLATDSDVKVEEFEPTEKKASLNLDLLLLNGLFN